MIWGQNTMSLFTAVIVFCYNNRQTNKQQRLGKRVGGMGPFPSLAAHRASLRNGPKQSVPSPLKAPTAPRQALISPSGCQGWPIPCRAPRAELWPRGCCHASCSAQPGPSSTTPRPGVVLPQSPPVCATSLEPGDDISNFLAVRK